MAKHITVSPVTRIEGHLAVHLEIDRGVVSRASCSGEMFRGFETILKNRDPFDAQQITQRICGVCPVSHGIASVLAQDDAYGITPPENGRLMRNIILAANYLQSHILHFYHLSALDFVDITAVLDYQGNDEGLVHLKQWVSAEITSKKIFPAAPFLPRYKGHYAKHIPAVRHYLEAFTMRQLAHQLGAVAGGKLPHAATLVPGGVTETVDGVKIAECLSLLKKLKRFIESAYWEDIVAVGKHFPDYFSIGAGPGNFLCYGVFRESDEAGDTLFPSGVMRNGALEDFSHEYITEDVGHSYYQSATGLKPMQGETEPAPGKDGAYSWLKAPRYDGHVMEVGPLARVMVAYARGGNTQLNETVDRLLDTLGKSPSDLVSVLGRHAARLVECLILVDRAMEWVNMLDPGKPVCEPCRSPDQGSGIGLTEAPRGALGHFLSIKNKRIESYQCVVPTTWNCSPRDDRGQAGAVEQALAGTRVRDSDHPLEATRVVRSFDPCIACAVH